MTKPSQSLKPQKTLKLSTYLGIANLVFLSLFTLLALVISPKDQIQGDAVRLLYIHVPTAWLAYLSFIVTSVGCVMVLLKKNVKVWDSISASSAQIGLLFCGITIMLGMLWGKPTWGVFWTWDARLITTAILFLSYLAYLAVRSLPKTENSQRVNAIVGVISAINIPIVHFSVNWWRTLHQDATVFNPELKAKISGVMAFTLWFGVLIFSLLYVNLIMNLYKKNSQQEDKNMSQLEDNINRRLKEQKNNLDLEA
jgi:heme exporter protein C